VLIADATRGEMTAMARSEVDPFILSLRDEQGLTFEAIAARTGLSKKSVQVRYYKLVDSDAERISKVYTLHSRGLAPEAIARQLNVHAVTVARWTGSRLARGRSGKPEVQKRLLELVNQDGLSISSAAKQLGLSRSAGWYCYHRAVGADTSLPSRLERRDTDTACILKLRDRDHLSWRAIASRMSMSPTGVRKRYYANTDHRHGATAAARGLPQREPDMDETGRRLEPRGARAEWPGSGASAQQQPSTNRRRPQEKLIVRLRDEGMSFAAVASHIGSTASTVRALYYSAADGDIDKVSRARLLRESGLKTYEIARLLHVHEATIARWTEPLRPGRRRESALADRVVHMRDKERKEFDVIARELRLSIPSVRRRYRMVVDTQQSRIHEARALYQAGCPVAEVAQRLEAHEETIHRWTALRPIRGRVPRLDVADDVIQHMRDDQGLTFRAIGERTGLSESTVWRRYKQISVTPVPAAGSAASWADASP
jgi:transposase